MSYIYVHINPYTNKVFYIGCCYSNNDRINDSSARNEYWQKEVDKIGGFDKVKKEIICQGNFTKEEIRSYEYYLAQYYYERGEAYCSFEHDIKGKNNPNYNNKWSKNQREYLSKKMTGRYVGEDNPNYNNKWNEQQRKRMSKQMHERYNNGFINGRSKMVQVHLPDGTSHVFNSKKDMRQFIKTKYGFQLPLELPPNKEYKTPYYERKILEGTWYQEI